MRIKPLDMVPYVSVGRKGYNSGEKSGRLTVFWSRFRLLSRVVVIVHAVAGREALVASAMIGRRIGTSTCVRVKQGPESIF